MRCGKCGRENPAEARFCAVCGSPLEIATPPATAIISKPGVVASYRNGWHKLWPNFGPLLIIFLITLALGGLPSFVQWAFVQPFSPGFLPGARPSIIPMFGMIGFPYAVLVAGPLQYGVAVAYLKSARGERPQVANTFYGFRNYGNSLLANLLVLLILYAGFILLVVPGIILACKLAFVPYLVTDRKMTATTAIAASWRMTGGFSWKIFLIGLLAVPIFIGGAIVFGVGIIIATMWISLALASFYHSVSSLPNVSQLPVTPV